MMSEKNDYRLTAVPFIPMPVNVFDISTFWYYWRLLRGVSR